MEKFRTRITVAGIAALLWMSAGLADVDHQCIKDCTDRRYTWAYCEQVCAIAPTQQSIQPANPVGAFIEGRIARQEYEAQEIDIERQRRQLDGERLRLELQETEEETARLRQQLETRERAQLKAENEALKQKLKELAEQETRKSTANQSDEIDAAPASDAGPQ
jgi:hypothetical protein